MPVKDGLSLTRALVESVTLRNPGFEAEWVIVDSGSVDGTLQYCAQIGANVTSLQRDPFNYCAALNAGAARASGEILIFSNNDIEFRSSGDLERIFELFRTWPLLGVLNPWDSEGDAAINFRDDWLYGPCWAVRSDLFHAWGGMPEELSGYGYDELWTLFRCWSRGRAVGLLPGWRIFHHGSATFGSTGATARAAMRRNLRRLLELCGESGLDDGAPLQAIVDRLLERQRQAAPQTLRVAAGWNAEQIELQGMPGVKPGGAPGIPEVNGLPENMHGRQWLPWLANELLLQPDAPAVAGEACSVRRTAGEAAPGIGPPAPKLLPRPRERKTSLKERLAAWLHECRHRSTVLPPEW